MQPYKRVEPTTVTKVGYLTVVSKHFVLPNGKTTQFDIDHPDGTALAGVIALLPDKRVLVARQFRPGPEKLMDDLPGGFVENGENPEEAVRREFSEETGFALGELTYLGQVQTDAYTNITRHYFLATNCTPVDRQTTWDENEFIEQRLITIDELISNAKEGRMTDSVAVLLAYDKLKALSEA